MASNGDGELRRQAERDLNDLVADLLDHKVRRALSGATDLEALAAVALAKRVRFTSAARVFDRFRYCLANVAMRCRQWELAAELLDAVSEKAQWYASQLSINR